MSERDDELRRIRDMAVKHAVEEMDAAGALTLETQQQRGDRGWLTGMAAKSIGVAVRIEQFMALRSGRKAGTDDDEDEEESKKRLVKEASAEVKAIMKRVRSGAGA